MDRRDKFDTILDDLEADINYLTDPDITEYRDVELKLKYATLLVLKDINLQLYEISRYGIGTY